MEIADYVLILNPSCFIVSSFPTQAQSEAQEKLGGLGEQIERDSEKSQKPGHENDKEFDRTA